MKYGLSEKAFEKLIDVFKSFPEIENVIIFGSRADGNFREGSDIDLAVEGDIDYSKMLKIRGKIEELNLPWEVDLIDLNNTKEEKLVEIIRSSGIVIYSR